MTKNGYLRGGYFRLEIPWHYLCSDNVYHRRGKKEGRQYAEALRNMRELVVTVCPRMPPISGTSILVLRFAFPDNRQRDMTNHTKLICDGLKGLAITDDDWHVLYCVVCESLGVQPDNPRVDLFIEPYTPGTKA